MWLVHDRKQRLEKAWIAAWNHKVIINKVKGKWILPFPSGTATNTDDSAPQIPVDKTDFLEGTGDYVERRNKMPTYGNLRAY